MQDTAYRLSSRELGCVPNYPYLWCVCELALVLAMPVSHSQKPEYSIIVVHMYMYMYLHVRFERWAIDVFVPTAVASLNYVACICT